MAPSWEIASSVFPKDIATRCGIGNQTVVSQSFDFCMLCVCHTTPTEKLFYVHVFRQAGLPQWVVHGQGRRQKNFQGRGQRKKDRKITKKKSEKSTIEPLGWMGKRKKDQKLAKKNTEK